MSLVDLTVGNCRSRGGEMKRRLLGSIAACLLLVCAAAIAQDKPAQEKKKLEPPGIKKEQLKGEALENWRKKHDTSGEDFEKNGAAVGATIGSLKVTSL